MLNIDDVILKLILMSINLVPLDLLCALDLL